MENFSWMANEHSFQDTLKDRLDNNYNEDFKPLLLCREDKHEVQANQGNYANRYSYTRKPKIVDFC